MAGEHLPARIDLRADRLRDAEDDAAGERAPQAAEPADDHRLEAEDQPRRADRRIEIGAHRQKHAGDRDHRERQRHGEREDVAVVEAHQLRHRRIVGGGAEGAAERGAVEHELQRRRSPRRRRRTGCSGSTPIETPSARRKARDLDRAGLQLAAVGGEQLQQAVLDDHRQAERHQQRRQQIVAERAVEHAAAAARSRSPPSAARR